MLIFEVMYSSSAFVKPLTVVGCRFAIVVTFRGYCRTAFAIPDLLFKGGVVDRVAELNGLLHGDNAFAQGGVELPREGRQVLGLNLGHSSSSTSRCAHCALSSGMATWRCRLSSEAAAAPATGDGGRTRAALPRRRGMSSPPMPALHSDDTAAHRSALGITTTSPNGALLVPMLPHRTG